MRGARIGGGLLALVTALSCFSDREPLTAPDNTDDCSIPGGAIGPDHVVVFIRGFAFHPDTVRVSPGTTVTWVNCEAANVESHTSSAVGGEWDSNPLAPGASFAHEFSSDGSFGYFCRPHSSMRGAVLVD
jgi:plastocyanin